MRWRTHAKDDGSALDPNNGDDDIRPDLNCLTAPPLEN